MSAANERTKRSAFAGVTGVALSAIIIATVGIFSSQQSLAAYVTPETIDFCRKYPSSTIWEKGNGTVDCKNINEIRATGRISEKTVSFCKRYPATTLWDSGMGASITCKDIYKVQARSAENARLAAKRAAEKAAYLERIARQAKARDKAKAEARARQARMEAERLQVES